jgi:hypothetical protein
MSVGVALAAAPAIADAIASTSETTIGYNNARTNWDPNEPGLAPSAVTANDFGKLFETTLPGTTPTTPNQIYAQPIVADGMLIVATEEDLVAGLDPQTGTVKWTASLGTPWTPTSCGDLTPHIGVTSTPVYDPATDSLYVSSKSVDDGMTYQRLHALDPSTGHERSGWPVTIKGSLNGITFNPSTANQRPGLLLLDGSVYLGYASHCDHGPYVGWVVGVNTSSRSLSLWASEAVQSTAEAGIWQSGGGLVSDGPGRIFVATGNGVSPPPGPGAQPPGTLAESVVRLQAGGGVLSAKDFFSPANNARLDQDDADLGSGAPIALPDSFGTATHPHLLVECGKDGVVRLLDRDNLGGMGQGAGGTDADLSEVHLRGLWGRMAAFASDTGNYLFLLPSTSPLEALRVSPDASGVPALSVVAASSDIYAYTSGSPIVTSAGSSSSSAVTWVVTTGGSSGAGGYLRAYGMPPQSGAWTPLASFPLGTMAKFVQPATTDGRVYVGTRDGRVLAFGRPTTTALSAPSTDFGEQPVSQATAAQDVTVTAVSNVTVKAVSTAAPFSADTSALTFPMALSAGQTFTVPVTFTPSSTGAASANLDVLANSGASLDDTYAFALHGIGTAAGLGATPTSATFPDVSVGMAARLGLIIQNTSSSAETIEAVTPPSSPFSLVSNGAPLVDATLAPQQSITLTLQFAPTAPGLFTDQLHVEADDGPELAIPLSGLGITGAPALSFDTPSLNFGNVQPGQSRTLAFVLSNAGTSALTINKAASPVPPFTVPVPVAEGQTLQPGDSLTVQVKFTPASAEPVSDKYLITGSDGRGPQTMNVVGNQQPWSGAISSARGCLELYYGRQANGTPAVSSMCRSVTKQLFAYDVKAQTVHVGSLSSSLCLDVRDGGTASGTPVQFWTCNGSGAQHWAWRADNSFYNSASGKCLSVPAAGDNVALTIDTCKGGDAQSWDLSGLQAARGAVSSAVAATNQICLDDSGGKTSDGNPMQTWRCNLTPAQILTHAGTALRVLGRCLDVAGGASTNGTPVQLYRCNGSGAQQWQTGHDGRLVNVRSGKCLDIPGGSATPGKRLQIFTCNGTAAQRWTLPG